MSWTAQNFSILGSPNVGAHGAWNVGAHNVGAYNVGAHNVGAYNVGAHNVGAHNVGAHNVGAFNVGAHNVGAHNVGATNVGATGAPLEAPLQGPLAPVIGAVTLGTGAGSAGGRGFLGGYGAIARFEYATPVGLSPLPWSADFTVGEGWPPYPVEHRLDPFGPLLAWQAADWDPALRFWTLPFDPQLTEWLQDLNLGDPSIMAAREFAGQHRQWLAGTDGTNGYVSPLHAELEADAAGEGLFAWRPGRGGSGPAPDASVQARADARAAIDRDLIQLVDLMRDDRARYLEETAMQSGQIAPYFIHLLRMDPSARPWTVALMNCASAIGNLVKMQYKAHYRRVRPSTLCPGLVPPWGPPRHPAFPSGHSTVAHLTAMFLLSVPGIARQLGIFDPGAPRGRAPRPQDMAAAYGVDQRSPMLWLAWRIAKGRERLGLHYPTDSAAGRRLAVLLWQALGLAEGHAATITVPALDQVRRMAQAEWADGAA